MSLHERKLETRDYVGGGGGHDDNDWNLRRSKNKSPPLIQGFKYIIV
jgi:hypothetical protein